MQNMDTVFSFPEAARLNFLHSVLHSFRCAYICLWSFTSLSNRLFFLDGFYNKEGSSLGSVDQSLFARYRGLEFDVTTHDRVPGLAFRNHYSYLELQQSDLLSLAWTDIQRQFFLEARIKMAVFMGCCNGEIELGFSTFSQGDIKTGLRNLFPQELSRQISRPIEQNNPPSSSSSLRSLSLSTGSPEYSSLLPTTIPATTSLFPAESPGGVPAVIIQPEGEEDEMVRAILQVISSPSSNNSTSHHHLHNHQHQPQQQHLPYSSVVHEEGVSNSAFKRYYRPVTSSKSSNLRRQSLLKRSFELYRGLNSMRMRERSSAQLLHMISERRRREKLKENFLALRALLPPGTKKDKASILTTAKETVRSLKADIERMIKRNQDLEALQNSINKKLPIRDETKTGSSNERVSVRVSEAPGSSSSSEERIIELHVTTVRAQSHSSQVDILIRLLEFLKGLQNLSLASMDANTRVAEGVVIDDLTLRIKIEESEWDEAAFLEAVRRVVADLAQ